MILAILHQAMGLLMSNPCEVILHIGAHKTATTYVQSRMNKSKKILCNAGIEYIGLSELRKNATKKLGNPSFQDSEIVDFIAPYMKNRVLIISDENILGGNGVSRDGRLYPDCRTRLSQLLSLLEGSNISVYLTIRDYADYLTSRYFESLSHNPFVRFQDYIQSFDLKSYRWPQLVEDVREIAGSAHVYCNSFDYLINNEHTYFKHWFGRPIRLEKIDVSPEIRRAKLSSEEYEIIERFSYVFSATQTPSFVRFLTQQHTNKNTTAFNPFAKQSVAALAAKYTSDINIIKNLSGVQWLG